MIEGMAEYLSIGSVDPHTSMWMRDAILSNDFPTLKQLSTDSKYFPYRYGQAFWAWAGKTWGDTIIIPLLEKLPNLVSIKLPKNFWGMMRRLFQTCGELDRVLLQSISKGKTDSLSGGKLFL